MEERRDNDRRSSILMLYQKACEYYCQLLSDSLQGVQAREYLARRGLAQEVIEAFKIGYATNYWDGLVRYLTANTGVAPSTLEEAGLVRRRGDTTTYFDLFRHRLMIPICDDHGRVIAFGGRTLGDDQIKYLNSPESPIYTKGQHLFAFHLAKESIKTKDAVIVAEGYFDAISAHQFGFTNTVATLGTALTEHQARSLVRYTESKRVYLSFDADAAGLKAVDRGIHTLNQVAQGTGIDLRVIRIPGGKDPDECLHAVSGQGIGAFQTAIDGALPLIDHQIEQAMAQVNLSTHTGRIEAARQVVPVLGQIHNSVARGEYIRQMSARLLVREEELLSDVGQFRLENHLGPARPQALLSARAKQQGRPSLKSGYYEAEQQLLALFLTSREDHDLVGQALGEEDFLTPAHQTLRACLLGIGSHFNNVEDLQYKLMDRVAADKATSTALIEVILKVEEIRRQNAPVETLLKEFKARLLKERLNRAVLKMRELLASSSSEQEQEDWLSRIRQLMNVMEKATLVSTLTLDDLDDLRRRIVVIMGAHSRIPEVETMT